MKSDPRNAVQIIHEKVHEHEKELIIIAIGPLTNVASAIISDPSISERVGGLVIMGGAFNLTSHGFGNVNSVAEFNIWHDPDAARIVFNSGIPLVCAGLDTTTFPDYRMNLEMFEKIKSKKTRISNFVADLCQNIVQRFNGLSLHDPQAIAYVIDPSIFKTERHKVDVETIGELTKGMTVVKRSRYQKTQEKTNTDIIIKVNSEQFHSLVMERIVGE
jgi:inosine-uridine nucleoside N-ribohydrolase